jgi:hypothetical protein
MRTRPAATAAATDVTARPARMPRTPGGPALGAHEAGCDSVARARLDDDRTSEERSVAVFTGVLLNVAVADCAVVSFTAQSSFFPVHAPLQPRNDCPAAALAVSAADAPALKCCTRLRPAGARSRPRRGRHRAAAEHANRQRPRRPGGCERADALRRGHADGAGRGRPRARPAPAPEGRSEAGDWLRTAVVPGVKVAVHVSRRCRS